MTLNEVIRSLILGIIIIVIAVPEGLPLSVTISIAYSVNKMIEENSLVRNIKCFFFYIFLKQNKRIFKNVNNLIIIFFLMNSAFETMAYVNNICCMKTGTLTENKM